MNLRNETRSLIQLGLFDRVFRDQYDPKLVVEIRETCSRGNLVVRVNDNGKLLRRELLVITGSAVSGFAGDPDSIKAVYARPLVIEGRSQIKINMSEDRINYDPDITVVGVGTIDYLDRRYKNLFEVLDTGF